MPVADVNQCIYIYISLSLSLSLCSDSHSYGDAVLSELLSVILQSCCCKNSRDFSNVEQVFYAKTRTAAKLNNLLLSICGFLTMIIKYFKYDNVVRVAICICYYNGSYGGVERDVFFYSVLCVEGVEL